MNTPESNQHPSASVAARYEALTAAWRFKNRTSKRSTTENDGRFGDSKYGTGQHSDDDDGCYTE